MHVMHAMCMPSYMSEILLTWMRFSSHKLMHRNILRAGENMVGGHGIAVNNHGSVLFAVTTRAAMFIADFLGVTGNQT